MVAENRTYVYAGVAGEGEHIGSGGLYRYGDEDGEWHSISHGLPPNAQVRALLVHPEQPAVLYAGTQQGPYRSDDRGAHWEALESPQQALDVWSLAFHPHNSDIIYAGYEPCAIARSEDGGAHWRRMNTDNVVFPHITTYMPPLAKRVIDLVVDPTDPLDVYAAIEVGGLLASRDGGERWESITNGLYVRNNTLDLHAVQVSAAAPGTVYIATQIAMFRGRDRGHSWEHVRVEEMFPGGSYCRDLLVAPNDPHVLYLAAGAGGGGAPRGTQEAGALVRSLDAGETWERVDIGETPPSRMAVVAIDRGRPSHTYCCTRDGQLYGSSDSGKTWQKAPVVPGEMSRRCHVYALACG
jgi:photosystem II stability/assembly factor-like uncharacterized protein